MATDANILMGIKPMQTKDPMELYEAGQRIEQNRLTGLMNTMKMDEYKRGVTDQNTLRDVYRQFGTDSTANTKALYGAGLGKQAGEYAKAQGDLAKDAASTGKTRLESTGIAMTQQRDAVNMITSPDDVKKWLTAGYNNPDLKAVFERFGTLQESMQKIDAQITNPEQLDKWKMTASTNADTLLKQLSPDANARLTAKTSTDNNTATNATSQANNTATNATSRANNAATVGLGYSKLAEDKRSNGVRESDAAVARGQSKVPAGYRSKLDGTLEAIPGGPADLKINAASVAKVSDAKDVLGLLDEVDKILPKATGGVVGTGVDAVLGAANMTTNGADATAQLKAIEGALISKMPKMSGPQSDKDVLLYRQMAGEVGNSMLPTARRQAAANTVRKLNEKYAGMTEDSSAAPQDQQAMQWAKSNPNDPRSKAIMQRLGGK